MLRRWVSVAVPGLAIGALLLTLCGCGGASSNSVDGTSQSFQSSSLHWLGSTQTIVSTSVPDGPAYAIIGSRYRFWGRDHLQIGIRFADPWRVADAGRTSGWGEGNVTDDSQLLAEELQVTTGCQVRPFAIVRGLLTQPGDIVFARAAGRTGRMIRLDQVAMPASLHTRMVVVYGAMPTVPSGFVLRTRAGDWIRLSELSSGRASPAGCAGQERAWVDAHFSHAQAGRALADITRCLRGKGFEVGAPDYLGFEEFGRRIPRRQFGATQQSCRAQAAAST
jgi:hypothetical protein